MQNEIAVRFYTNNKFGTTYGKGQYRKAVFNATADMRSPKAKYLLDLFSFNDWENMAKTDADMEALALASDLIGAASKEDVLATWVKRMDSDGTKSRVEGFGVLNMGTGQLSLLINDEAMGIEHVWQLDAKPCRQNAANLKSPQLLATNAELS